MTPSATPKVVVSQCLGFAAVRYDGQALQSRFVQALRDHVEVVQVCPEVGIGLGVPRDPIRIEVVDGERRLLQPSTGRDLTRRMRAFAEDCLDGLEGVDGFILKAKSPSCGIVDTKILPEGADGEPLAMDSGLFAQAVLHRFPWVAIQDEERLTDPRVRHRFLTHLWALARLRRVEERGDAKGLTTYHSAYRDLWRACGPEHLRRLDRLVSDPDRRPLGERVNDYRKGLGRAMAELAAGTETEDAVQRSPGYPRDLRATASPNGSESNRLKGGRDGPGAGASPELATQE